MPSETAPKVEVPGWYIEFQAALLRQAPRPGEITKEQAMVWTDPQQGALHNTLHQALLVDPRFKFLGSFSLTVPQDYDPATGLARLRTKAGREFSYWNPALTDKNFSGVTVQLVPDKTYTVKLFGNLVEVKSEDWMSLLHSQRAILVGAQGEALAMELAPDQLPVGKSVLSFDEKKKLPVLDGYHRVPRMYRYADGDWNFDLNYFENGWAAGYLVLCFCDDSA